MLGKRCDGKCRASKLPRLASQARMLKFGSTRVFGVRVHSLLHLSRMLLLFDQDCKLGKRDFYRTDLGPVNGNDLNLWSKLKSKIIPEYVP